MPSTTLGRNQVSASSLTATQFTILAALPAVINLREVVQKDRKTVVHAEEVVVEGEVRTEGQNVTILCRRLRFLGGGSINADGRPAEHSFPPDLRKEGSRDSGAPGADGDDGSDGFQGGVVDIQAQEIIGIVQISARGGLGGRGQDGGHGRAGAQGPRGQDAFGDVNDPPARCFGGPGRQGGAVGLPGRSGRGGTGGKVQLQTVTVLSTAPQIDVQAGQAGETANPGKPGEGGLGGPGGTVSSRICEPTGRWGLTGAEMLSITETAISHKPLEFLTLTEADSKNLSASFAIESLRRASTSLETLPLGIVCTVIERSQAPSGGRGSDGDRRTAEVANKQAPHDPVQAGSVEIQLIDKATFASQFGGSLLDLLASSIEDDYCSHGSVADDALKQRIAFLLDICVDDAHPSPHKIEVMARAYSMARRIALGLDFFGYSLEHAPLLSFETYSNLIDTTVIPSAQLIESSFNAYWDARTNAETRKVAIRNSQAAAAQRLVGLEMEHERKLEECRISLAELPALDRKVEAAYAFLMTKEAELTAAIKAKGNGCNLVNSLTAVATIVAGVASGGAGFVAAASAGVKLYDDFTANDSSLAQLWDSRKLLSDDMKQIGEAGATVAKSITDIANAVDKLSPEQRRVPQFRMERDQFDKVAKDFVDMPEAASYRDAGYDYLRCVETRNQAILDYNALIAQAVELQAKTAAAHRVSDELDSALAATTDPSEAVIIPLMTRLYMDTLTLAAQMVHAERKALAYHFARPMDAPLSKLTVATIVGLHQKTVLRDWFSAKERYAARRELEDGELRIDLSLVVSKFVWESFRKSGLLAFTLRRDHPAYSAILEALPGLRLTGMSLDLAGAKVSAGVTQVPWKMNHAGHEAIYRSDDSVTYFSHKSINFTGFTPMDGQPPLIRPDFSEKNLYAGVSPYASWLLTLSRNTSLGLDLSHLDKAVLRLSGYILEG